MYDLGGCGIQYNQTYWDTCMYRVGAQVSVRPRDGKITRMKNPGTNARKLRRKRIDRTNKERHGTSRPPMKERNKTNPTPFMVSATPPIYPGHGVCVWCAQMPRKAGYEVVAHGATQKYSPKHDPFY